MITDDDQFAPAVFMDARNECGHDMKRRLMTAMNP
jgi:hypothetical protein